MCPFLPLHTTFAILLLLLLPNFFFPAHPYFQSSVLYHQETDGQAHHRRSNIPCGTSFFPCRGKSGEEDEQKAEEKGGEGRRDEPLGGNIELGTKFRDQQSPELEEGLGLNAKKAQMAEQLTRMLGPKGIRKAVDDAEAEVAKLINRTEVRLFDEFRATNFLFSSSAFCDLFRVDRRAKAMSHSALVSLAATRLLRHHRLSPEQIRLGLPEMPLAGTPLEHTCPPNAIAQCVPGKFRSYSGHCNNVNQPLWGAAYEPMERLQPPDYADGVDQPRQLSHHHPILSLPNPRTLSARLLNRSNSEDGDQQQQHNHHSVSLLLVQWAQFAYEDIARIGTNQLFSSATSDQFDHSDESSIPLPCCADDQHQECFPIIVDTSDHAFNGRGQCIPYARSVVAPRLNCSLGVREQANLVSSFLDASHVYGSSKDESRQLRLFSGGLLNTSKSHSSRLDLLPPTPSRSKVCHSSSPDDHPCFFTGSSMTNLLPSGAALHTVWVRHHNRLANKLALINPFWEDERLFQEARRIVIAQFQHITFNEWLPLLLGREGLGERGLLLRPDSFDSDYNIKINPTVLNEFAAGAGLFFLALFPDSMGFADKNGSVSDVRPLSSLFNDPSSLYQPGRVDSILRFLLQFPVHNSGPQISDQFRDKFLRGPDIYGTDLASLIIQMGRDHGLNGYTSWRQLCGLSRPTTFEQLLQLFHPDISVTDFALLYGHVDDVDLFVGGLSERPLTGSLLGPTFSCIFAKQFERIRHGDRFWYENFFQPSALTQEQLMEVKKTTMAAILCDNSDDIGQIQPKVFQVPDDYGNNPISCNTTAIIERLDMSHWRDSEAHKQVPITQETLEKAIRLGVEQYRRLQEAETGKVADQQIRESDRGDASAVFAHASLMAPKDESLDIAVTAGILRETTKVLLRGDELNGTGHPQPVMLDVENLQRLMPPGLDVSRVINNFTAFLGHSADGRRECLPKPLPCDHTAKYRTFSGWCNNLRFPHYGNAFEPLRRLLPPAYDDGFDSPRSRGHGGQTLPSARRVSNLVHSDTSELDQQFHGRFSHMLMQFGQILDHDMTHSPIARGSNNTILNCSSCDSVHTLSIHCFPIRIEPGDPHFPDRHDDGTPRCMPFARSLLGQLTLGYRNQLNQLSSFLDASYIYGSTDCEANALRLFNRGRLNFTDLGYNRQALPQGPQERDCRSRPLHPCFNAGDERNNEQPGLTVMHTILLRQHNKIAMELNRINTFWSDEQLYQETRRILVAKLQHVVYNEWLPMVLGYQVMARYELMPQRTGYFTGYDPNCDASISQELATAAMRFGHTLIRNVFPRMNVTFEHQGQDVRLEHNFSNVSSLYDADNGHMESLLMGLLGAPGMEFDRYIVDAVRNHLFQQSGGPFTGLDLPAVNIQRGRDHGIPPYNSYRHMCGLQRASTFDDLADTMSASAIDALRAVYAHVDDVDLFPGLMSERPLKGALVGPMLACILAEQFQRLKRCDRFYYENGDPTVRFTPGQLSEIRKTTLSRMICESSEYAHRIQPNAFLLPDELTNAPIKCSEIATLDLYEWLDRQFCVIDQQVIKLGKSKRIRPCVSCTCTSEGPECHSVTIQRCPQLLDEFDLSEIRKDTVCLIQCASAINEWERRLL